MIARSNRSALRAACFLFLLLLPVLAAAQPPTPPVPETDLGRPVGAYADPVAEVKALELERFGAMVRGDSVLVGRMLGEDLTYTHSTGAVDTKETFVAALASGKLRYQAITPADVSVRILLNAAAVVTGRVDMKVVLDGKEATFPARFTSVYAKRHGRWLLVAWQSTRLPQP